jgi:chromosome segregation ATPase
LTKDQLLTEAKTVGQELTTKIEGLTIENKVLLKRIDGLTNELNKEKDQLSKDYLNILQEKQKLESRKQKLNSELFTKNEELKKRFN